MIAPLLDSFSSLLRFSSSLLLLLFFNTNRLLQSDHQMLAYIKRARRQEAEAQKVQEGLRAELCRFQERVAEVERIVEEKAADVGSLQKALQKEEFVSAGLKAGLALEEQRRKEGENKLAELEARMAKSVSEAATRAVEEFKTSSEM